jgi:predicted Zn finger-like uncharacterized protein
MDVRCEKCQTEYELDESKLKPGGVTVKCTTCGHMFKVRGRQPSMSSPSATPVPEFAASASSGRIDRSAPTPLPGGMRASSVLMSAEDGERTWLIRLEDGEIKTCRELSTLQKWIVSGRVSRSCAISRTGKKWKLLGEIGELASFFSIADEARDARASSTWGAPTREYPATPEMDGSGGFDASPSTAHPHTVPRRPEAPAPMHLAQAEEPAPAAEERPKPSYADALAVELQMIDDGARAGASNAPGAFSRTLPLGGAALPPRAASGADRHGQDAMEMAAQSAPDGYDLPIDQGDDGEPPTAARAKAPVLGDAPTLPTYGSGPIAGAAPSARAAVPGLPLAPPPSRPAGAPAGPTTGGWATRGQGGSMRDRDQGPSGPTSGQARGGRGSSEAAFVGGARSPNMRGEIDNGRFRAAPFSPSAYDEEPLLPPRSRAGLWVILFSLIVMAGAAAAVYLILFTGTEEGADEPVPVAAAADAGAVVPATNTPPATTPPETTPPETTPPAAPPAAAEMEKLTREAEAALLGDSEAALDQLAPKLAAFASGAESAVNPAFLVARGRVEVALAQQLTDRAKLGTPAEGKKLIAQSRAQARNARKLADQALALQADNPGALLLMADARRLDGERSLEVERWIKRARQNPAGAQLAGEADLVLALLRVRDDRLRDARGVLDKLINSTKGDARPLFRLAWIEYLYGNVAEAKSGAETVLKVQPDHTLARALLDKLGAGEKPPVETADPMPPEDKPAGGSKPDDKVAGGDKPREGGDKPREGGDKPREGGDKPREGGDKPGTGGGDSFDAILARADSLAENGNCGGAMPLYRKVLDMNPASVEALTGLAYCHLDRREYASAYARFRAALGISSRYQPAMWGIAEAYQQQGLKQQALERFEAFLAEHPSSQRASAAKLRIEHLKRELSENSGSSEQGSGSGETPPSGESGSDPSSGGGSSAGEAPSGSGQEAPAGP